MSLAAWIPSSLSAFSITLLRSRACRSSALIEQPIVLIGVRVFACQTAQTRMLQSRACRQTRRSIHCTAEPSQPTSYARSFGVAGRRTSTATRTNSLLSDTPTLVVIRSQIRRILSHSDGDYANVTSNMRWRPAGRRDRAVHAHAPYTGWQCNGALWHARHRPRSHAASAAGNSGGRTAPSPAARSCADGEQIQ